MNKGIFGFKVFQRRKPACRAVAAVSAFALLGAGAFPALAGGYSGPVLDNVNGGASIAQSTDNVRKLGDGMSATLSLLGGKSGLIDWSALNIGSGQSLNFQGGNFYNVVQGGSSSQIAGTLKASGSLWIFNPAGVSFFNGAQVDVSGVFSAAAAGLANHDEMFQAINDSYAALGADPETATWDVPAAKFGTPEGNISVEAGTAFNGNVSLLGRQVSVSEGAKFNGDLTMTAASGQTDVDEVSGGKVSVSINEFADVDSDINVTFEAATGEFAGKPLNVSGDLNVSTEGSIYVNGAIKADGDIAFKTLAKDPSAPVISYKNMSVASGKLLQGKSVSATAAGRVQVDGDIEAVEDVDLNSGLYTAVNGSVIANNGNVNIEAVGNVNVAGKIAADNGSVDVAAAGAGKSVKVGWDGANLATGAEVSGANVTLTGDKSAQVLAGKVTATDAVILTGSEYVAINGDVKGGSVAATTTTGGQFPVGEEVHGYSDRGILQLSGNVEATAGDIEYNSAGVVNVAGGTVVADEGAVAITAGDNGANAAIIGAEVSGKNGVAVNAVGNIKVTKDVTSSDGAVVMKVTDAESGMSVKIQGGSVTGKSVELGDDKAMSVQLLAGEVKATGGNVEIKADEYVVVNGDVTAAGGDVGITTTGKETLTHDLPGGAFHEDEAAGVNVLSGTVTGENVTIDSKGSIQTAEGTAIEATDGDVKLTAHGTQTDTIVQGINLNGAAKADAGSVSLKAENGSVTGSGEITADELALVGESFGTADEALSVSASTIAVKVDNDLYVTKTGDLTVGTVDGVEGVTAGGTASIDATEALKIDSKIDAESVVLKSGDGISAKADIKADTLALSSAFTQTAGDITVGSVTGKSITQNGGTMTATGNITVDGAIAQNGDNATTVMSAKTIEATTVSQSGGKITATEKVKADVTQSGCEIDTPVIEGNLTQTDASDIATVGEVTGNVEQGAGIIQSKSEYNSGNLTIGGTLEQTGGEIKDVATLTLQSGGSLGGTVTADSVVAKNASDVTQDITASGSVTADGITASTLAASGTIKADTIDADVTQTAGTINSKNGAALKIDGTLTQNGADAKVGSATESVEVTGALTQTAGEINATTLTLKGGAEQTSDDAAIVATALMLDNNAADVSLTAANNDFDMVQGTAKNLTVKDVDGLALDDIGAATLTVTAAGDVTQVTDKKVEVTGLATVTAEGKDITLDSAANDFQGAVNANGANVTLTDANSIRLGEVTATGTLGVEAKDGAITQTADGKIVADDDATTLTATDGITLGNAANDFQSVTANAKSVTLNDADDVTLTQVAATDGNVDVTAGKQITATEVEASGDVTLTAAKNVVVDGGTVKAGNFSVDGDGNVTATTVGNLTVNAGNGVTAQGGAQVGASGDATVTAKSVEVNGSALAANGNLEATASDGNVTLDSATVAAHGTATLTASADAGKITAKNSTVVAEKTVTLDAGNDVKLEEATKVGSDENVVVKAGKGVTVEADAQVLAAEKGTAANAISVTATSGDVTVAGEVVAAKDGVALTVESGNIKLGGTVTAENGTATLTADNGAIVDDDTTISHGDKDPWATGTHSSHLIAQDAVLSAKSIGEATKPLDVAVDTLDATATEGAAYIWEKDGIEIKNLSAKTDAAVENLTGDITLSGAATGTEGNLLLAAKDGKLELGDTVSAGEAASLLAGTTIEQKGNVTAKSIDAQAFAADGKITVASEKTAEATAGSVRYKAETVENNGKIKASGNVAIDGNNTGSGKVEADGAVVATGSIAGGTTVNAKTFIFDGTSVGESGSAVNLNASTIAIHATDEINIKNGKAATIGDGSGTVTDGAVTRVFLDGETDTVGGTSSGGPAASGVVSDNANISIENAGTLTINNEVKATADGKNVTIKTTAGDIDVNAEVTAGAAATLDAAGKIRVKGDVTGADVDLDAGDFINIAAGKTVEATTGKVTADSVAGNVDVYGTVKADNGDVTLTAAGDGKSVRVGSSTKPGVVEATEGSVVLTGGKSVQVQDNSKVTAGKDATLAGGEYVLVDTGAKVTAGDKASLTAGTATDEGEFVGILGEVSGETVEITAHTGAKLSGVPSVSSYSGKTADDAAGVFVTGGKVTATGTANIVADGGDVVIEGNASDSASTVSAKSGLEINATGNITVSKSVVESGLVYVGTDTETIPVSDATAGMTLNAGKGVSIEEGSRVGAADVADIDAGAEGVTVNGGSILASKGVMTIDANGGAVKIEGNSKVASGAALNVGMADGKKTVSLTVDDSEFVANGDLTAKTTGNIDVRNNAKVASDATTKLDGASVTSKTGAKVLAEKNIDIDATGAVTMDGATVAAKGNVLVGDETTRSGSFTAQNGATVTADGNVSVYVNGDAKVDNATVKAGNFTVDGDGNVDEAAADYAVGNLTIDAGNAVEVKGGAQVGASGKADIDAGTGGVTVNGATLAANGDMTIDAEAGNVTIKGGSFVGGNSTVSVGMNKTGAKGTAGLTVGDATDTSALQLVAKGDLTVKASRAILAQNNAKIASDATTKLDGASVTSKTGAKVLAEKNIDIDATGAVTMDGATVAAKGADTTTGTGDTAVTTKAVDIQAGTTVTVNNGTVEATDGSIDVKSTGAGAIEVKGDSSVAAGNGSVTIENANGNVLIDKATVTASENVIIGKRPEGTAAVADVNGGVTIQGGANVTGEKGVEVYAKNNVRVNNATVKAGKFSLNGDAEPTIPEGDSANLSIDAGKSVKIEGGAKVGASGNATVTAKGDDGTAGKNGVVVTGSGTKLVADKGLKVEATATDEANAEVLNNVTISGGAYVAGKNANQGNKVEISSAKGSVTVTGKDGSNVATAVEAGKDLAVTAYKDVTVIESAKVGSNQKVSISSSDGNVEVKDKAMVIAKTGVDVAAPGTTDGNVTVSDATIRTTGGDVNVGTSTTSIGGSFTAQNGATVTADAGSVKVYATGDAKVLDTSKVVATGGDAVIDASKSIAVDGEVVASANATLTAKTGIEVSKGDDATQGLVAANDGKATLTTETGGITVKDGAQVTATGDVDLKATKSGVTVQDTAKVLAGTLNEIGTVDKTGTVSIEAGQGTDATAGAVAVSGSAEVRGTGDVSMTAKDSVKLSDSASVTATSGSATITAQGNDGDATPKAVEITGTATVEAGTKVDIKSTSTTVDGAIEITTTGKGAGDENKGITANNGAVTINNANGAVTIQNAKVEAKGDNGNVLIAANGNGGDVKIDTDAKLTADRNLTINASKGVEIVTTKVIEAKDGDAVVIAQGGFVDMKSGTAIAAEKGNVVIEGKGNVNLATVTASTTDGTVYVKSANGDITDANNNGEANVTAKNAAFSAANGAVGAGGNHVETSVDVVAATSKSGVFLTETEGVTVGTVAAINANKVKSDGATETKATSDVSGLKSTDSGAVVVEATAGDITVSEAIDAKGDNGNVLVAADSDGTSVTIDATVTAAQNASVTAGKDVNVYANVTATAGDAYIEAQNGDVTMKSGTTVEADGDGHNVRIAAKKDVNLSQVVAENVSVKAETGSITDNLDAETANVTATKLRLEAGGDVGTAGASGDNLNTDVVNIEVKAVGAAIISEENAVTVGGVDGVTVAKVDEQGVASGSQTDADLPGIDAGESATLVAGDKVTVAEEVKTGANLLVKAKTGGIVQNANVKAKQNVSVIADNGDIDQNANITATAGTIDVEATGGSITMADGTTSKTTNKNIRYKAGRNIAMEKIDAGTKGAVTLDADGDLTMASVDAKVTADGLAVKANAVGTAKDKMKFSVSKLAVDSATGVYVDNDKTMTVTSAGGDAFSVVRVNPDATEGSVSSAGINGVVANDGDVDLDVTGKNNDLVIDSGSAISATGTTDINASGSIIVNGQTSGKSTIVNAGGDVTVNGGITGAQTVKASGNVNVNGTIKGGSISVEAGNSVAFGKNGQVSGGGVTVTANSGDITQEGATVISARGYVEDRKIHAAVVATGKATLSAEKGSIGKVNVGSIDYVGVDGVVTANAGRDVAIADATGKGLTIDSDGISGGVNAAVYTKGSIARDGDGGAISAPNVIVSARDYRGGVNGNGAVVLIAPGNSLTVNNFSNGARPLLAIFETDKGGNKTPKIANQPNDTIVFIDGRLAGGDIHIINKLGALEAFPVQTPELKSEQGVFGNPNFLHDELDVANPFAVGAIDFLLQDVPLLTLTSDFPVEVEKQVAAAGLNPTTSYWFGQKSKEESTEDETESESGEDKPDEKGRDGGEPPVFVGQTAKN